MEQHVVAVQHAGGGHEVVNPARRERVQRAQVRGDGRPREQDAEEYAAAPWAGRHLVERQHAGLVALRAAGQQRLASLHKPLRLPAVTLQRGLF